MPGYRSFAIGGWGTLLGESFRAFGGRRMALLSLEYQLRAPFPALPLGAFVSTGRTVTIAPFVSAGLTGGEIAGLPWRATTEVRPVVGVAIEWFHRLLRSEVGVSLRTGRAGVTVDINREWWDIL
jgi:outer membrane protein assembly factor BamA